MYKKVIGAGFTAVVGLYAANSLLRKYLKTLEGSDRYPGDVCDASLRRIVEYTSWLKDPRMRLGDELSKELPMLRTMAKSHLPDMFKRCRKNGCDEKKISNIIEKNHELYEQYGVKVR